MKPPRARTQVPGDGLRLGPAATVATPSWVGGLHRGRRVGGAIRYVRSTSSTNDLARAWLDADGPDGLAVLAEEQTAGRGRRGRPWSSPPGLGLYLSVGLRPDLPGEATHWLTFLGSVAAAEALRAQGLGVEIRWPNDLDAGGRKLGGVLAETRLEGGRVTSAVLGIGLNLRQGPADFPPDWSGEATSFLMERHREPDVGALVGSILDRLEGWYLALASSGGDARAGERLLERWRSLAPGHQDLPVEVEAGSEVFRGRTRGIEPDGGLRIERDDGRLVVIRVGELRRLRPARGRRRA